MDGSYTLTLSASDLQDAAQLFREAIAAGREVRIHGLSNGAQRPLTPDELKALLDRVVSGR
jgi:hypothetical protein